MNHCIKLPMAMIPVASVRKTPTEKSGKSYKIIRLSLIDREEQPVHNNPAKTS